MEAKLQTPGRSQTGAVDTNLLSIKFFSQSKGYKAPVTHGPLRLILNSIWDFRPGQPHSKAVDIDVDRHH